MTEIHSIEDIQSALEKVCSDIPKVVEEGKYVLKRARILRDYKIKRNQGKSRDECYREIAKELNESVETVRNIERKWQYL